MMKKTSILILFAVLLSSSCKKLTQFDMEYTETAVIPASTGVSVPFNIYSPDVESNSESTFEIENTRKDLIEQIKLTDLEVTISSPSSADFSFLESIHLYLSADGIEESLIAWKDPVSTSDNKLILEVSDDDLQEYVKKDEFTLRTKTVTDEFIGQDHHLEIYCRFFVDAKLIK